MLLQQGYPFRLRQRSAHARYFARVAGCCRFVWNQALSYQREELGAFRARPRYAALCAQLVEWKCEHPFLLEAPAQALQQSVRDLEAAWQHHLENPRHFRTPRFKNRQSKASFRLPQRCRLDVPNARLVLPKVGAVRLRLSRVPEGTLKNVTIWRERGRWYATLQTERESAPLACAPGEAVGVDMGVAATVTTSDGRAFRLPGRLEELECRRRRYQRQVSRRQKGSNRRGRARAHLARISARIAACRKDFLHKMTTKLASAHPLIALEDLRVHSMTASARGTKTAPGKNVRAKARLNRAILAQGWSEARRQLEYKVAWRGGLVVAVPPAYSSQECVQCTYVSPWNRTSLTSFECRACGYRAHADVNAARVILARGLELLAAGSQPLPGGNRGSHARGGAAEVRPPLKREPAEAPVHAQ
jgi:putative transposase